MYMPNDVFLPFVLDELKQHPDKTATINLRGRSMRPFLEHERDKALLALPKEAPRKGDAVLAEISPGHYVLHRIVSIDGDRLTLRGDGNLSDEHCTTADVRALAVGFLRKGRQQPDKCSDKRRGSGHRKYLCHHYGIRFFIMHFSGISVPPIEHIYILCCTHYSGIDQNSSRKAEHYY